MGTLIVTPIDPVKGTPKILDPQTLIPAGWTGAS